MSPAKYKESILDKTTLTNFVKRKATEIGFDKVGIVPAGTLPEEPLREWLRRKYHGRMGYMANHFEKRVDPEKLVDNSRSIISVAKNYYTPIESSENPSVGRISRYAWGDDYHDVLRPLLKKLLAEIQTKVPGATGRCFVDTAPIMDKQWAVRAGIGWQGKNSNVISREFGSWLFLGEVVVSVELDYDEPIPDYCGTCTRCIDACPTGAIVEPYVVDGSRCISYLTIELKPEYDIPPKLGEKMGNMIFGCDICQDVCPWNKKFSRETDFKAFHPRPENLNRPLSEWQRLTEEDFCTRFRKSPVKRPRFAGLMRNVAVALRNSRSTKKEGNQDAHEAD